MTTSSKLSPATDAQFEQIRLRAVNDITRPLMAAGVLLTHDQADDLGEEALGWIGGRLGLNVNVTADGVECTPPRHYSGEAAMRAGIEVQGEAQDSLDDNYTSAGNGLEVGSGYDVEVLRMRDGGDDVLVCWTEVGSGRSGITEATVEGRTLHGLAVEAGGGALADWDVQWSDDDGSRYDQLAQRWDARMEQLRGAA